ncbi:MAG: hypothetical protein NTV32_05990 [Gammaproteobacteria bacterium]|nr:hypothetical protein [Gammaproteobacteria bacterium]
MLKKYLMSLVLASMGLCISAEAIADGANIHVVGGMSLADLGGNQYLSLGEVTNQLNTSGQTTLSPFILRTAFARI